MSQYQRALDPDVTSEENRSVESPVRGQITLKEVKASAPMEAPADDGWLDLPLPDWLPAETPLSEVEKRRMHGVLSGLLEAIKLDHPQITAQLDALLTELGKAAGERPEIETAGLPLTPFQATDYDRYFRVNRQSAEEPAVAMVRSLIQTVRAVTQLFARSPDLPVVHVRHQMEGFESHAHLLARTFGLEPLR
ncbi:hypothetical protein [Agrobacterium vitis]|uniref:Siderophore biosynthesis protein n=1 Tax=Agrobacterium vitis TaxID=373 RepID=A0AAE2UTR5_AGRVI|nr:hypothetical protein [Agrobacterium vitis]MBF2714661.1 hypothetical protein [Agrobacterium vitis]MUZ63124.1 hypothetical protein [Agrobacterium vitis]